MITNIQVRVTIAQVTGEIFQHVRPFQVGHTVELSYPCSAYVVANLGCSLDCIRDQLKLKCLGIPVRKGFLDWII